MASVRLFLISYLEGFRKLEKSLKPTAFADDQVTQMRRKSCYEVKCIESLGQHLIKCQQG
jgi:hypothetical protein